MYTACTPFLSGPNYTAFPYILLCSFLFRVELYTGLDAMHSVDFTTFRQNHQITFNESEKTDLYSELFDLGAISVIKNDIMKKNRMS